MDSFLSVLYTILQIELQTGGEFAWIVVVADEKKQND